MTRALGTRRDPREVELKFCLPRGSRAVLEAFPPLAAVRGEDRRLTTTYFDTPDGRLDQAGLTLRVRRNGEVWTQTVKSRANGDGVAANRSEWEWPVAQEVPDVGLLAKTAALAAAAIAAADRLEPVFATDIRRTTRLIRLDGGTIVEAAFDEGEIVAGDAREAVGELELELKRGRMGPVYRLAADLQAAAPMWLSPESKAARGRQLRSGRADGAPAARPAKLKAQVGAAAGLRQILNGALGHLTANIGPTLRGDPEGLHQLRVAVRAVRAAVRLFADQRGDRADERFEADLRGFGEILGAARDWDVFCLETLPAAMADSPEERLGELLTAAQMERLRAHHGVAETLRGREFSKTILGLAIWADDDGAASPHSDDGGAHRRLAALAPALLARAAGKAMRRARHVGKLSQADRHRLRKALKTLNFDVERLAGLFSRKAVKKYRSRCGALGKILGEANDAIVAERLARRIAPHWRPDLAEPARALRRWSKLQGRRAVRGLKVATEDFRTAPAFWK